MTASSPKPPVFGGRISRTGEVFAYLARPVRGRVSESNQRLTGHVIKVPGGWRHDAACDVYPTQNEAAAQLIRLIWS